VGAPLKKARVFVRLPLLVRGTIVVPGNGAGHERRIHVSRVLGDQSPSSLVLRLPRGTRKPKIDLTARPLGPVRELRPPGGRSWVAALRSPHPPQARELLARANSALLTLALAGQYENYLGNPDSAGRSSTTYHYVSGAPPAAVKPAPPTPTEQEGVSPWALLAFGIGVGAAILGLTILWARS
jgi:hypothetical protein